jgi:DNA-binding MarR family transcriptional regulator
VTELPDEELVQRWDLVLSATASTHRRVLRRIEDSGVPGPWFAVLHRLLRAQDHRLPMSHLAKDLSITSGGFTKLADRMAREGLIDRRGSSGDRRVVYATLTPSGLDLAERLVADYKAAVREYVADVLGTHHLDSLNAAALVLASTYEDDGHDGIDAAEAADDEDEDTERRGPGLLRR